MTKKFNIVDDNFKLPKEPIDGERNYAYSVNVQVVSNGWIVTILDFNGMQYSQVFRNSEGLELLNAISLPLGFEVLTQ